MRQCGAGVGADVCHRVVQSTSQRIDRSLIGGADSTERESGGSAHARLDIVQTRQQRGPAGSRGFAGLSETSYRGLLCVSTGVGQQCLDS